jgi:hypothetical protein
MKTGKAVSIIISKILVTPSKVQKTLHSPPLLYNLNLIKFPIISRPVTLVVAHSVGKSSVDENVSAYPKNSIGGIQPRAYSSAKHAESILYCLTSPRRKWCTEPAG